MKCPCCQLELNFGRDAKLFDDHYRACKREKKKQENDGKNYLVPQMCPQCGKTLCSKQSLDNHLKVRVSGGISLFRWFFTSSGQNLF